MSKLSRRNFLKLGGSGVAATGATIVSGGLLAPGESRADTGKTTLPYEPRLVGHAKKLKSGAVVTFNFPDESSPCTLLRFGKAVPGGVGPKQDIVAYSTLCAHMGCPVNYDDKERVFRCPCHFSIFDPEMGGQMVDGQATEGLSRIVLDYNEKDDTVSAVGVDGLIYGRQSNVL